MSLYEAAGRVIEQFDARRGLPKVLCVTSSYPNKGQLTKLVLGALAFRPVLSRLIVAAALQPVQRRITQPVLIPAMYDLLIGTGLKAGGRLKVRAGRLTLCGRGLTSRAGCSGAAPPAARVRAHQAARAGGRKEVRWGWWRPCEPLTLAPGSNEELLPPELRACRLHRRPRPRPLPANGGRRRRRPRRRGMRG